MAPTLENTLSNRPSNNSKTASTQEVDLIYENTNTAPAVKPLGEFSTMLTKLERAFSRSKSSVDVDEVWRLLEDYNTNPKEWTQFAYYDMTKYKRNLVAEYDKYNVMIITWGPGSRSCIHDHAGSHCFMKMLDGELVEGRFAWPEERTLAGLENKAMLRVQDTRMHPNDVVYIHDKVGLHLVENTSQTKTAASLHVYIPPYRECKAFDPRTGRAVDCELKFFSKCGRVIEETEDEGKIGIEKTSQDKFEC